MPVFKGVCLLCLVCSTATAATIFQSGKPATEERPVNGMKSDDKDGVFVPERVAQWAAASFSVTTPETIRAISFEGFYLFPSPPSVDEFEIRFFQGGGSLPGEAVGGILGSASLSRVSTGVSFDGSPIYRYELDLSSALSLEAGDYWISIVHTSTYEDFAFFWSYIDENTPMAYSNTGPDGPYEAWGATLVFTLESTRFVPEPSTFALTACSFLLVLRSRRRG